MKSLKSLPKSAGHSLFHGKLENIKMNSHQKSIQAPICMKIKRKKNKQESCSLQEI